MNTPSKDEWKKSVKKAVINQSTADIEEQSNKMSTLSMMTNTFVYAQPHPSVALVDGIRQVTRANVKTRLLTKTYPIMETLVRIRKAVSTTCPLCQHACEDTEHFVVRCPQLSLVRSRYMGVWQQSPPGSDPLQAILDSRSTNLKGNILISWEKITRDFLFALHLHRANIVQSQ